MAGETILIAGRTPQPISALLVDDLREQILSGALKAGERLRQDAVARDYGVSTTPVREAFGRLYSEGLLIEAPYKGAIVFEPTVEELEELYTMRLMIEPAAARIAVPNLSEADFAALKTQMEEMTRLLKKPGDQARDRTFEANIAFHDIVYSATGLPRLISLISQLRSSSHVYVRLFARTVRAARVGGEMASMDEHEAIYRACLARNLDDVAAATAAHLRHTLEVVRQVLEEASENGSKNVPSVHEFLAEPVLADEKGKSR
jgi:DNA-binding GntR family transcriptional regulator